MSKFLMLVSFDPQDRTTIRSCYSPDFDTVFFTNLSVNDFKPELMASLLKQQVLVAQDVVPKTLEQLSNYPIFTEFQYWQEFEYHHTQKGFFARALPVTGHVANATAIISGGYVTYMAMQLLICQHGTTDLKSDFISATGATLDSFLSMVVFTFSGTTLMLANAGANIDARCRKAAELSDIEQQLLAQNANVQPSRQKLLYFVYFITLGIILTDTCIRGINTYQQIIPLIDNYLDLYPNLTPQEREHETNKIRGITVYLLLAAWSFTNICFQANFANMLIKHFMSKPGKPMLTQFNNQAATNDVENTRPLLNEPRDQPTTRRNQIG